MIDRDHALFARIVEAGSLSAAARALSISPAMVSKRLARLEERLGARLVNRTTRRLALTEVGAAFHLDLQRIMAEVRAAEERVTGTVREPAGRLRVSMPTSFGRLHVAPRLHLFLAAHPRVELEASLSDGFVDLIGERVDVAIRITADVPASVTAHRLAASRRVLCAAPDYLERNGAPALPVDLARHRLLAAEGQLPWRLLAGTRRAMVDRPSHVRTNSSELVRELALTGVGIALRSLWDVAGDLHDGRLVRVLPDWEGRSDVGIFALHHAGTQPPSVPAFVACLRSWLAPAPWDTIRPGSRHQAVT